MATINLGKIKPLFKDVWQNNVQYKELDIVAHNISGVRHIFICTVDCINVTPTVSNNNNWGFLVKSG
jgi:hypothetical protein